MDDSGIDRLPHASGLRREPGRRIRKAALRRFLRGHCACRGRDPVDRQGDPRRDAPGIVCVGRRSRQTPDGGGRHHHRGEVGLRAGTRCGAPLVGSGAGFGQGTAGVDQEDISGPACAAAGVRRASSGFRERGQRSLAGPRSRPRAWSMRSMHSARTSRLPWTRPSVCCGRQSRWDCPLTCTRAS